MEGLRVLVDPLDSDFNSFVPRFAQALGAHGAEVAAFDGSYKSMAAADVVIFHWPKLFMGESRRRRALLMLARMWAARLSGTKFVWVAHNVVQHEDKVDPLLVRLFLMTLSGIIYLSEISRSIVEREHGLARSKLALVTRHGSYDSRRPRLPYAPPEAGEPVRLGSVGLVRRYKNLEDLIAAAGALSPDTARLLVTGRRQNADYAAELEALAAGKPQVGFALKPGLLSEDELEEAIDGEHGIVLPYRDILNSGSAIHALSRGRPVLVPAIGSMPELAHEVGEDWVRLYHGTLGADALSAFARHLRTLESGAAPDLSAYGWPRVAADLDTFLNRLCGRRTELAYA